MKEYTRMKLWAVSLWKPLFKEELIKVIENSDQEELFDLLIYCYDKYSDMHPEILSEVFSDLKNSFYKAVPVEN